MRHHTKGSLGFVLVAGQTGCGDRKWSRGSTGLEGRLKTTSQPE